MARNWHPLLAAHEYTAGEWLTVDPSAKPCAVIKALRIGDEAG